MLVSILLSGYSVGLVAIANAVFAPDNTETRFVGQNGFFTLASFSRLLSVLPIPIDRVLQPLLEVHLGSEAKLLLRPFCI